MLNPSTAVVMDIYEKFGKGDVPGILASCTDDVCFEQTEYTAWRQHIVLGIWRLRFLAIHSSRIIYMPDWARRFFINSPLVLGC